MKKFYNVMISSTTLDLPKHRKLVIEACRAMDMNPLAMEYLTASGNDPVTESLRLVNQADIYLGIFGRRYGDVPLGQNSSMTEIEMRRAQMRKIPILAFFMREDHAPTDGDVVSEKAHGRLLELKKEIQRRYTVDWFSNSWELKANVALALAKFRHLPFVSSFTPTPPSPYIAHPYTLLDTYALVGREEEQTMLMDWLASSENLDNPSRILSILAIGGMGKSALLWKWFHNLASKNANFAGRIWWSFYEQDAEFDNFISHTLAYVTGVAIDEIPANTTFDRENYLLKELNENPFIIVLDGLERTLTAYFRPDSVLTPTDEETAPSDVSDDLLRRTADHRLGTFLRKFAQIVQASRIVTSTRLHPADLETPTGEPIRGTEIREIAGLKDHDAFNLWKSFGVRGTPKELIRLFRSFDNYPLLIRALAKEVSTDLKTPRDFNEWRNNHPDFDPFSLSRNLVQRKHHVLHFSLSGLNFQQRFFLNTISTFRMPVPISTIMALLMGKGKLHQDEKTLKIDIEVLRDRGLIGWDRNRNHIDAHPVVRGVVWNELDRKSRRNILQSLRKYLERSLPLRSKPVESYSQLTTEVELYFILVRLGEYESAVKLLQTRIINPLADIGQYGYISDLIGNLFEAIPSVKSIELAFYLSIGIQFSGQPQRALSLYQQLLDVCTDNAESIVLLFCGCVYHNLGRLYKGDLFVRKAFINYIESGITKDIVTCYFMVSLGELLATRGKYDEAEMWLNFANDLLGTTKRDIIAPECILGRTAMLRGDYKNALQIVEQSIMLEISERAKLELYHIRGAAFLKIGNTKDAFTLLSKVLSKARQARLFGVELSTMVDLADCYRQMHDFRSCRELIEDLLYYAGKNNFVLIEVDALNVLAQLEREIGDLMKAKRAALRAIRAAFCNHPTFTYARGFKNAYMHLKALNISEKDKNLYTIKTDDTLMEKGIIERFENIIIPSLAEILVDAHHRVDKEKNGHKERTNKLLNDAIVLYDRIIARQSDSESPEAEVELMKALHEKGKLLSKLGNFGAAMDVLDSALGKYKS